LAFCWAHQRRDFLELVNSYPQSAEWALQWVDKMNWPPKNGRHEVCKFDFLEGL
jgi:hypothetical protein